MALSRSSFASPAAAATIGAACGAAVATSLLLHRQRCERKRTEESRRDSRKQLDSLVILVGMRGAGKSTLGRKVAENLGRCFLDLDEVLEKKVLGCSINDFVASSGWAAFREAEAKLLEDVALGRQHGADAPEGCIAACGGGIVETPSAQRVLSELAPVVFIDRHIDDIVSCLEGAGSYRPGLGTPPREVYARRLPIYLKCSSHVFTLSRGDDDWSALDAEFARFVRHAEGAPGREVLFTGDTFIVTPDRSTLEDLAGTPDLLREATAGTDVVEVCAGALGKDPRRPLEQLAVLRRRSFAPICLTVGSAQAGYCCGGDTLELAKLAIRAGCQLVEVGAARLSQQELEDVARMKGATKLIAGHREVQHRVRASSLVGLLRRLASARVFDLVRLVLAAHSEEEVFEARNAVHVFAQEHPGLPVSLTLQGKYRGMSCVLNGVMTLAAHPGAPGQMPVREIMECRSRLSLLDSHRSFFIFGHPVALSASPTIHNTGFRLHNMPFAFARYDAPDVEDVLWKLSLASTGGGAVTIPHKEELLHRMDELSESARAIGAVNTVTKQSGTGTLKGDNTDWIGISKQLEPKLVQAGGRTGLIIGAGGTARAAAYAFKHLGFEQVYVLNRTVERASALADAFGTSFKVAGSVQDLEKLPRLDAVMATVPGGANAKLPEVLLKSRRPVVMDAAYQSSASGVRFTALLQQARDLSCPVVEGLEMLFEQGCAQSELWTGRPAPRQEIARALLSDRFAGDPDPPRGLLQEAGLAGS